MRQRDGTLANCSNTIRARRRVPEGAQRTAAAVHNRFALRHQGLLVSLCAEAAREGQLLAVAGASRIELTSQDEPRENHQLILLGLLINADPTTSTSIIHQHRPTINVLDVVPTQDSIIRVARERGHCF